MGSDQEGGKYIALWGFLFSNYIAVSHIQSLKNPVHILL